MNCANLANHGSNTKESGHFATVRNLICRSTWYIVHSLAPLFLGCGSASIAQTALLCWSLKDPSLTETHRPSRIAAAIAEPSSVMSTCVTDQLVAGTKRERRSWRVCRLLNLCIPEVVPLGVPPYTNNRRTSYEDASLGGHTPAFAISKTNSSIYHGAIRDQIRSANIVS
jgi:hypothetical protein